MRRSSNLEALGFADIPLPEGKAVPETTTAQNNVETILRLENEAETDWSIAARVSETIGRFAGTISFVIVQSCLVGLWLAINIGGRAFDPRPFPLLSLVLAVECVMLAAFILIRQNRMSLRADRRTHLALQINLLSEQEATKIIQILERMSRQMGIESDVTDSKTRDLATDTSIEGIVRDLRQTLSEETAVKA